MIAYAQLRGFNVAVAVSTVNIGEIINMECTECDKGICIPNGCEMTLVVRCKSCKFSVWNEKNKQRYCGRKWAMHKVRERDYCSYGIRK